MVKKSKKRSKTTRSKAGKSQTRKPKTRASKSAAAKVEPTYLKPGASYTLGIHDVVAALKMIEKHRHLSKLVRASKKAETSVSLDADTVNWIKDFLVKNKMHTDPIGKHIVNAAAPASDATAAAGTRGGNPAECKFGRAG